MSGFALFAFGFAAGAVSFAAAAFMASLPREQDWKPFTGELQPDEFTIPAHYPPEPVSRAPGEGDD